MTFTLKFERRFCMAHRLIAGRSPKCAIPHGHNEFIRVSLSAPENPTLDHDANMISNCADAKSRWHQFIDEKLDHSFQVRSDDPIIEFFEKSEPHLKRRLVICPGDPTTELMCACLMSKLSHLLAELNSPLVCTACELEETPTNTVILEGRNAYLPHLPKGDHWWNRADMSINNF